MIKRLLKVYFFIIAFMVFIIPVKANDEETSINVLITFDEYNDKVSFPFSIKENSETLITFSNEQIPREYIFTF